MPDVPKTFLGSLCIILFSSHSCHCWAVLVETKKVSIFRFLVLGFIPRKTFTWVTSLKKKNLSAWVTLCLVLELHFHAFVEQTFPVPTALHTVCTLRYRPAAVQEHPPPLELLEMTRVSKPRVRKSVPSVLCSGACPTRVLRPSTAGVYTVFASHFLIWSPAQVDVDLHIVTPRVHCTGLT